MLSKGASDMGYEEFLDALGKKESGGDYTNEKLPGRLGKYQMTEAALDDAGYAKYDGQQDDVFKHGWMGKNGIHSKDDFLNSPSAQEDAVREFHKKLNGYIHHYGLDEAIGKTINGVEITMSGLLAGAHLVGAGGLIEYIKSNGAEDVPDGNDVPISEYIKEFAGFSVSNKAISASYQSSLSEDQKEPDNQTSSAGSAASMPGMK
jgi:hypothetical protein